MSKILKIGTFNHIINKKLSETTNLPTDKRLKIKVITAPLATTWAIHRVSLFFKY